VDRAGEFLARSGRQAGCSCDCGLVVGEEVDGSIAEVVEANVLEACLQAFVDGSKFGVEDVGGGSHGDDRADFLWQAVRYVITSPSASVELRSIRVDDDVGGIAAEVVD
jgi:hypothetical protein